MPKKAASSDVTPMLPREFNRLLTKLRFSQVQAAKKLGTSRRSVVAYSTGETAIPGPVAVALRCLAKQA